MGAAAARAAALAAAALAALAALAGLPAGARGHARLACPAPWSPATGAKRGPCGGEADGGGRAPAVLQPGRSTIVWEESIYHFAAPTRLALASAADPAAADFDRCVLLDHIPHGDVGPPRPSYLDEDTWVPYAVTVEIPDVKCDRCVLQMASLMTDAVHGVPEGTSCALEGSAPTAEGVPACPAVYYSCAAVQINGTRPVGPDAPLACDSADAALDWPFTARQRAGVYAFEGDAGDWTRGFPAAARGEPRPPPQAAGAPANASAEEPPPPAFARRAGACAARAPPAASPGA